MAAQAFAGRFAPRDVAGAPGAAELELALRRDGPASSVDLGPLALAWTRASAQPHVTDRSVSLIDGRLRSNGLPERLGIDPATPQQQLVARGYELLGEGVLEALDGSFALVLWDGERGRGVLAHDRLGSVPLFTARWRGMLLFASEIRNLLALLPATPSPDPEAMAHWLARTDVASARTLYGGIERLPAAHAVSLGPAGWSARRWWAPRYASPRAIGAAAAAAEVRAALERAGSRALEGSAQPAVMLSGGLDSAAVAAMTPGLSATYSAVFPEHPEVDESARIQNVRDWLGAQGVEMRFREGSALSAGAEFMREWELPSLSPNCFVWTPLLRRAAADGVDVVLDGEGGDELFGCAPYLVADRLRAGRPLAALRAARRVPGMGESPPARWQLRALRSYGLRAALPYGLHERLRRVRVRGRGASGPLWLDEDAERMHRHSHDPWAWKRLGGPRWWAQLAHALTITGDAMGAPDQLRREGRLCGVELRHPLRDPELIDLVLGLPPELAFDPRIDRPLARRALAGALPESTLSSDRKPFFNSLLETALRGRDAALLRETLAHPHPELAGQLRQRAMVTMLDGPPGAQSRAWALDLWRIATLEMWLAHCSGEGPALAANGSTEADFVEIRAPARQLPDGGAPRGSVPT